MSQFTGAVLRTLDVKKDRIDQAQKEGHRRAIGPLCLMAEPASAERGGGSSQHSLGLDTALARRVQAKPLHYDVSNDGEMVGGGSGAHGGLVLVELDVDSPVKPVSDRPVATHCMAVAVWPSVRPMSAARALAVCKGWAVALVVQHRPVLRSTATTASTPWAGHH